MKKIFSYVVLFFYFLFSQFAFKAVATTEVQTWSDDSFCIAKKLDTFEGKYSCREKSNSAIFAAYIELQDSVFEMNHDWWDMYEIHFFERYWVDSLVWYKIHAPPDVLVFDALDTFTDSYIWVTLQLL